jgi:hypothetical protein
MERKPGMKKFTTDGCSGFMSFTWRFVLGWPPPWEDCCIEHDKAYWRGGDTSLRLKADTELMRCVAAKGHPYWAILMFFAVRIGGPWWLPFPSIRINKNGTWHFSISEVRWGYGWPYPKYKE